MPIGAGTSLFVAGDAVELVGEDLLNVIHQADFSVFNLEVPLTDTKSPIAKCGPNLIAQTASVAGLRAVNRGAFALANNHIMDQGVKGLDSTIRVLDDAEVPHFGAGANLRQAAQPYIFERNGVRIGFYACAEHEFSVAGEDEPGANPFDPLESLDHVAALKERCDYVVVLYHGGKEHYRYPSPLLRKTCRKIAEKGADIVICQHSHCVGCVEDHDGATIVYGQGNFLFDHSKSDYWQTGMLLKATFAFPDHADRDIQLEYFPLRKHGFGVRLAKGLDAQEIMSAFWKRSSQIEKPGFVESEYEKYAEDLLSSYMDCYIPGSHTFFYRCLNKVFLGKLALLLTGKKQILRQINRVDCEAHRELYLAGLKGRVK